MKRILGLMLTFTFMSVACSIKEDTTVIPKELLSDQKGKYSYLSVHPEGNGMVSPLFTHRIR
ncbi:hypothetical protein [Ammoniphilus sp. YIM 78166]|uniref:hypothetical protein n=1 Tax=Ammoniphilus sp. YIM 78166 TaxID=1644106 RepID=UPI00106F0CB7|nr:hypothetical protein [Ammoniphilus sp. YIM 78166]